MNALSDVARDQMFWYALYDRAREAYVLPGGDDRFTNHSDAPNTGDDGAFTVARHDILPGEEITADYRPWDGSSGN